MNIYDLDVSGENIFSYNDSNAEEKRLIAGIIF